MAKTIDDFLALMVRSRLFSPEEVQKIARLWQGLALHPTRLDDFQSWLLDRQYLTPYQMNLLQEGRVDFYFLDEFRILERIGKGRMAGVYKALNRNNQPVALKVLPPSKTRNPEILARFQREGRLAIPLDHFSVVKTYQYGECRGIHYLVMEYLEGTTLEEVLATRDQLTTTEAVRLGILTSLGLQHIHEHGLVHRDLKPANLMLWPAPRSYENTTRAALKILDIGLGRQLFDPDSRDGDDDLTSEGSLVGTPDYLAPEQARDPRRADIRADLYSLGCTLYHMLAGRPPFPENNPILQIMRHATQQAAPLQPLNPQVGPVLEAVVQKLMAKDPSSRYQTPAEVAAALRQIPTA